jgi:thioredoxin-related protein
MKKIALGLLVCWAALQVSAADLEWLTDFPKAEALAKKDKKMILMDFTGSDWCGWCKKFKQETLDKPEFAEFAKKNLVLVELDFPSAKVKQSEELKKANKALQTRFAVSGFPTFVLLGSNGKELGKQVGYMEGGPKAFITKLEGFKK